ncbi:unnamed protein product [Clonostachys rosea]|uniref:Zn(2)-C6 fungal-type domain-containing protein n=1 Tax=Bionectria ochroleuca TaxID=29856 RepID=A0ABY6U1Q0_BIOOC|nr:unnamed protein product [Clonostachys rosea]
MERPRPRRVSRACVPCRRKKVKCQGEQPACSFCRRLGQTCEYKPATYDLSYEADGSNVSSRIDSLETKLDQVLNSLRYLMLRGMLIEDRIIQLEGELATTDLEAAGEIYLQWCHDQPISLFRKDGFLGTLESRDQELQLAICIFTARFPPGNFTDEKRQEVASTVKSCRKLVTDRIANRTVRLSTLQCLCIFSMIGFAGNYKHIGHPYLCRVDFANSRTQDGDSTQAGLDLTMATYLKDALPLGSSLGNPEEYRLCVQSISTLQNLQGCIPDFSKSILGGTFLQLANKPQDYEKYYTVQDTNPENEFYHGILQYKAQAAEIWHMTRAYAVARVDADSLPPWSPQSDYSLVMLRNLEFECRFPLKYRYATSNFGGMSSEP